MENLINLLNVISAMMPPTVEPQVDIHSPFGYSWHLARGALDCKAGEERAILEDLAEGGYLEKRFRDKLLLCPFSNEAHIAFREICPECKSADIELQEMIHHFRCGYVGPERHFMRAGMLVCPKCDYSLKHIGVDYERPSQIFACNPCEWSGSTPDTEGLCLGCAKKFEPEQAVQTEISAYALTARGALAARDGSLSDSAHHDQIIDPQHGTLSPEVVTIMYRKLEEQARRYKRPLSVISAHFDQFHSLATDKGLPLASEVMERTIEILNSMLRSCDMLAIFEQHLIVAVLPETPLSGAKILSERVVEAIRGYKFEKAEGRKATVSVGIACLDEKYENEMSKSLLTISQELAEEAGDLGGDRAYTMKDHKNRKK
ncbi:MAG: diguanylate cyclase [Planctomycetes bacterium]|nr:diguanylate cyclase [Planctomycetota bacterium]